MKFTRNELQTLAVDMFNVGALKIGTSRTPIHIDYKQLLSHPQLLARISTMLWLLTDVKANYNRVCGIPYNTLSRCGVPYRAITYAYQISRQTTIPMIMKRGRSNDIDGEYEIGDNVAIVDDEINNGNNIFDVARVLMKEQLKIGEIVVLVDRQQGGRESLENAGIKVKSLFLLSELIEYLRDAGKISNPSQIIMERPTHVGRLMKQLPVDDRRRSFL